MFITCHKHHCESIVYIAESEWSKHDVDEFLSAFSSHVPMF